MMVHPIEHIYLLGRARVGLNQPHQGCAKRRSWIEGQTLPSYSVGTAPECPETSNLGKVGVMPGDRHRRYPSELKERAVRMVAENVGEHESQWRR